MRARFIAGLTLAGLPACSTLHDFAANHPIASATGVAIIFGSAAITIRSHREHGEPPGNDRVPPICRENPNACL